MNLKSQKRIVAQIFECSPKKVVFNNDRLDDIKQAITKRDLKLLIGDGAITRMAPKHISRFRARKLKIQKSKGRRKGEGSRKGSFDSHFDSKSVWMNNIRVQRSFLKELITKRIITNKAYRDLYLKSKGGYFRSRRHIKLYLAEHDELMAANEAKTKAPEQSATKQRESRKKQE